MRARIRHELIIYKEHVIIGAPIISMALREVSERERERESERKREKERARASERENLNNIMNV